MLQYLLLYATAGSAFIFVRSSGTGNIKTTPTIAAGDFQVSIDGAAFTNITTLPQEVPAGGGAVLLQISAAELTCKQCVVRCVDQTAPKEWDDQLIVFQTYGHASAKHSTLGWLTGDPFTRLGAPAGASISADIAGVQSDTNDIQTRIPASLTGGRMDSSVGAMQADVLTASALATDAVDEIADTVWTENVSAYGATSAGGYLTTIRTSVTTYLDATISSRLAASAYIVPPTSGQIAQEVWNTSLPGAFASGKAGFYLDAAVSSRLAASSYLAGPTSGQIAQEVWNTSLPGAFASGKAGFYLDAAVSSRLASASYVSGPTSGQIAQEVWNTSLPGSYAAGRAGFYLDTAVSSRATSGNVWDALLTDHLLAGSAGLRLYTTQSSGAIHGPVQLDLTQVVPMSNTAQTVGDALNAARADGFGRWELVGNELRLYGGDGTTLVRRFALDHARGPTRRV